MFGGARKDDGFTLVEVLIAMFIFSLISVGTMTAMTSSLTAKERLGEAVQDITEIQTARAIMQSDMANIILRKNRDPYGNYEQYILKGGDDTLLTFTRSGRDNPGGLEKRSDLQRVSYVFENGSLIRRSFATENPSPQTPLIDRVLLDDLDDASVTFELDNYELSQLNVANDEDVIAAKFVSLTLVFNTGDSLTQKFEFPS